MEHLKEKIRHVPDFPKVGILFYDITTLLRDRDGFREAIETQLVVLLKFIQQLPLVSRQQVPRDRQSVGIARRCFGDLFNQTHPFGIGGQLILK